MAVRDDANFMFEDIVTAGYNFVNVDYVLTPEGYFPDQLMQLTEAIDFCADNAEEYGLDMTNVVVMGSSAGAQHGMRQSPSAATGRLPTKGSTQ